MWGAHSYTLYYKVPHHTGLWLWGLGFVYAIYSIVSHIESIAKQISPLMPDVSAHLCCTESQVAAPFHDPNTDSWESTSK